MSDDVAGAFEVLVDNWVLPRIQNTRCTFASLVCDLPGVYPSAVLDSVRRLAGRGRCSPVVATEFSLQASHRAPSRPVAIQPILPPPHPLDYDWRFAETAIDRVLSEVLSLPGPPRSIVFLGAPSCVPSAVHHVRQVIALDANEAVVRALQTACPEARVLRHDAVADDVDPLEEIAATTVVDPPWYPEYLRLFLWAGSKLCELDGHVLVSLPPLGTRPGIEEERQELVGSAAQFGLRCIKLEEASLPYVSPLFERNALRAEGLHGIPLEWRRGDLAVFKRVQANVTLRPEMPPQRETWCTTAAPGLRLRRHGLIQPGFRNPKLMSLVTGDILPTVSRRDPRRDRVDLWTTGNRVFACDAVPALATIIAALLSGESPTTQLAATLGQSLAPHETALVDGASAQLRALLDVERTDLLDEGYDTHVR